MSLALLIAVVVLILALLGALGLLGTAHLVLWLVAGLAVALIVSDVHIPLFKK